MRHHGALLRRLVFLTVAALCCAAVACGSAEPKVETGTQVWDGPGDFVSSTGVTTYDRREIAQKVLFPSCVRIADDRFKFREVVPQAGSGNPPGLFDTMFRLDKWRLWTPPGAVIGQKTVFVTVRGSTGILGAYDRLADPSACPI